MISLKLLCASFLACFWLHQSVQPPQRPVLHIYFILIYKLMGMLLWWFDFTYWNILYVGSEIIGSQAQPQLSNQPLHQCLLLLIFIFILFNQNKTILLPHQPQCVCQSDPSSHKALSTGLCKNEVNFHYHYHYHYHGIPSQRQQLVVIQKGSKWTAAWCFSKSKNAIIIF